MGIFSPRAYLISAASLLIDEFPPQTAKRGPGFRPKPRNQKALRRNSSEAGAHPLFKRPVFLGLHSVFTPGTDLQCLPVKNEIESWPAIHNPRPISAHAAMCEGSQFSPAASRERI